jgi:hypothetical protein
LDLALSRAAAAEEKLAACEAKLRLAETATTDAENRAGRVKLLAESERTNTATSRRPSPA